MNFLSHGYEHLDTPYLLAGTAVPDWLGLVARGVRLREAQVREWTTHTDPTTRAVARGMLLHLEDDRWFHSAPTFLALCDRFTARIRGALDVSEQLRPSFVAHIAIEMLLDGVLEVETPGLVDSYYAALENVDPLALERIVSAVSGQAVTTLAPHVGRFKSWRFLGDYNDDERFCVRVNQVLSRVDLAPLPPRFVALVPEFRGAVRSEKAALLPRMRTE
ncbi:MAG: hypothetical protein ACKVX7_19835 [Planctomycetota bacterium]